MEMPVLFHEVIKSARLEAQLEAAEAMAEAVQNWNEEAICIFVIGVVIGCVIGAFVTWLRME